MAEVKADTELSDVERQRFEKAWYRIAPDFYMAAPPPAHGDLWMVRLVRLMWEAAVSKDPPRS